LLYNQPYGVSDPNAPYINGNPSTGTMGSIPPAASIEYPQREIVNLITDAKFTPTNADLRQIGKAVQSGQLNYAPNTGVPGAAIAAIAPVPDAYYPGMVVRFKATSIPTGPQSLDAGRGPNPIIKPGGGPMTGGEWFPGDIVMLTNDGAGHWFLPGMPVAMLFANRDYYVAMTGSDTANDGTAAKPFLTIQKAWNTAQTFNLNGFNVTIHIADGGPYAKLSAGPINGSGKIFITGNVGNPQNVTVTATVGPAFGFGGAANVTLDGLRVASQSSAAGVPGCGVIASNGAVVFLNTVDFGVTADAHIISDIGGVIGINGPIRITGNATAHLYSYNAGAVRVISAPLTILNPVAFSSGFAVARDLSSVQCQYAAMTGQASVTGPRFLVTNNGVINTSGGGANYLPGSVAGTQTTGGQYV
jgi:hypothetical protein